MSRFVAGLIALVVCGCPAPKDSGRSPGDRHPLSSTCDSLDPTRCLLPWPSNTFTQRDEASPTGLRLAVTSRSLPISDSPATLNRVDGFSVATPLAFGFPGALASGLSGQKATRAVQLFNAQPGERFGEDVPVRLQVIDDDSDEALLLGWPHRPLEFSTDYVAVVLDEVSPGATAPEEVRVALGLVPAADDAQRALFAYHAPTRTVLLRAGIAAESVLRLTEFTTRSAAGHARPMELMRAAALAAPTTVTIARTDPRDGGVEVHGQVNGLPFFVNDAGLLSIDDAQQPVAVGTHAVPFRAVLPLGTGPYPMVIFGHGTGSSVEDPDLDDDFLATGAGKLNLEFAGWTRTSTAVTFVGFEHTVSGTAKSTAKLAQSLVDASALEAALAGNLGQALIVPELSGRTVDASRLVYFGSSLGGTLGFTHALFEPRIKAAVLNVPGAGCAQFLQLAEQWRQLDAVFAAVTPSELDRALGLVIAQTNWDLVDGAAWSAHPELLAAGKALLIQESIGDPVLPNVGSELVAMSAKAHPVSQVIEPLVANGDPSGPAAITQFRVPAAFADDSGAIHAFVTKDTPAGAAARQQLAAFLSSVWAGAPRAEEPPLCTANGGSCDFGQ